MLSKQPLPQLSDSDLILLNNSNINDSNNLDYSDLNCLDDSYLNPNEIQTDHQPNQFINPKYYDHLEQHYQINQQTDSFLNELHSPSFVEQQSTSQLFTTSPLSQCASPPFSLVSNEYCQYNGLNEFNNDFNFQ